VPDVRIGYTHIDTAEYVPMQPEIKKLLDLFASVNSKLADIETKDNPRRVLRIDYEDKERMHDFRQALIDALFAVHNGVGIDVGEIMDYEKE
jgi:hypothetical protein